MTSIHIHASIASGQSMKQLADILQKRMAYLNETARDSIAACALQVLRSLRTITLVAKPSKVKTDLTIDNSLYCSFTTKGRQHSPCLRNKGSNTRYSGNEKIRFVQKITKGADKIWKVYSFVDNYSKDKTKYLIVSPNIALAKQYAKSIVTRRLMRYAGLAKRAISMLMQKTFSKNVADAVAPHITAKANQVTTKSEVVSKNINTNGGTYTLTLKDNLLYAIDALRGGKEAVDIQMKKAMNKIVSIINKKIPDSNTFFGPKKIPTPFPEVRSRKND